MKTLLGYCPDCGVSRIPYFLTRCSRCCDTELKKAEQAHACALNKAFYGDDHMEKKTDWLAMIYGWSAQLVLLLFCLIAVVFMTLASGMITISKYMAAWDLIK